MMSHTVLILDDDADFNSLLTDIFEQADYVVTSLEDPIEAVDVFTNTDYDLVVTDHKMPDMTGAEFMKTIKAIKPEVPVVMVSGYLENDTIRDLIREGVGGVFLKPLNIFSLLERTSELIEESKKIGGANPVSSDDGPYISGITGATSKLGFSFRSFPCKSTASLDFAERLYSLRNFKLALTLIGAPGTHYRQICEDISNFYSDPAEHFVYFTASVLDEAHICSVFDSAMEDGVSRVTCFILEVEEMNQKQRQLAAALPKAEGSFSGYNFDIRVVFCVSGDLDELYDSGMIDEHLYILMGTAEVRIPSLRDCASDLAVMAQQILAHIVRKKQLPGMPHLDKRARDYVREQSWEQNYEELSTAVRAAWEKCESDILTVDMFSEGEDRDQVPSPDVNFESLMIDARKDIVSSAAILLGEDTTRAASFFGADTVAIDEILNERSE